MTNPREGWVMSGVVFGMNPSFLILSVGICQSHCHLILLRRISFPVFNPQAPSSLNARLANDFTGFQIQVAGVTVEGVTGERPAVFVKAEPRVERVRIGFFGKPQDLAARSDAVNVGLAAREPGVVFHDDRTIRCLDGLLNFRMKRLDLHKLFFLPEIGVVSGGFTAEGFIGSFAEGIASLDQGLDFGTALVDHRAF